MIRPTRQELLMNIAKLLSLRSTCSRKRVGALAAKDGRVLATGYNGAPSGLPHCIDSGECHIGDNGGCMDSVHAEANLVAFAAKHGISLQGATIYTTCSPCRECAKLLINAGVQKIVYYEEYRDSGGLKLLEQAGVDMEKFNVI